MNRDSRDFPGTAGRIEYLLTIGLLPLFGAAAMAVLWRSGMFIPWQVWTAIAGSIGFFLAIHFIYTVPRPVERLALLSGSLSLMVAAALLAGIVAHAGLRLRMPLADAGLAGLDRALGVDTPGLVLAFARHPTLSQVLQVAYLSIVPLCYLVAAVMSLAGRAARVWEAVLGYSAGIMACAIISVAWPALGNFGFSGLRGHAFDALPSGSGVYAFDAVRYYRDGTSPVLDFNRFSGVVTFPSFHAIMALIVAWALRSTGPLGWLASGWAGLTLVSTIPIGGHYFIDLPAGAAVWAALIFGARALDRRQRRLPARSIA